MEIQVTDRNGNVLPAQNRTLGILSAERWRQAQESLQENAVNDCRIDDRKASVRVTAEKTGTLLIPVAYTEGWQVRINGTMTAPVIWADGFLGVEVAEIASGFEGLLIGVVVLCITQFFAHGVEIEKDVDGLL